MYCIVETGGFQFKFEPGQLVKLPSVEATVGSDLELDNVLLVSNGQDVSVGTPTVEGAKVKVEVIRHDRTDKVVFFKKKRRTRYEKKGTHRQGFTEVLVKEVLLGSSNQKVDEKVIVRNRARAVALAKAKEIKPKLTRKQKIAAGLPKPAKVKKNSLRKSSKEA
ncbi:MAG TPA: 50S ribosomal protein L21 [Fibrobacteraceae bacterium]|nr:50S ribosomal protein L21 [Fibrobacteraceae bacterium]